MSNLNNHDFYLNSFTKFGISAKGVHWNSKENQYLRFKIIKSFIPFSNRSLSILDMGCGFAEFLNYLKQNNISSYKYIGIDCEAFMVEEARKRFPSHDFYVKNALNDRLFYTDYYVCSGTLNLLHKKDFFIFIETCYKYCNKALIFNFLYQDSFNNITIEEVLSFCKHLSKNLYTKLNYIENDMTICMKR